MSDAGVRVLSVLGRDYSIKVSASEDAVLQQAAAMLQERLDENRQRFPKAGNDDLLVLTALNLCVPLLEQGEQLREVERRLAATSVRIARQLQG